MPNLWPALRWALLLLTCCYAGWVIYTVAVDDCHWGFRALNVIGARCEALNEP